MDRKSLGKRINLARKDKGLTSEKLSELCDINATYLRQIEGGTKLPSLPMFVTLCRELDVSPAYLLADLLKKEQTNEEDLLSELQKNATPSQLRLVNAMVKSALEVLSEPKNTP